MRTKLAKEVLPVQMDEQSLELSRSAIGPLVLMSGYLTKKTHSRNRWLHRWYQLLDNGILQYYQTDKKDKLLGEIDIGRTCYDIRQGARNCHDVSFPRVAPRMCCFCFSVLKRTYYMYAPTAMETKKWFENIHDASNVLNRRVVAGVKRRKAPELPGSDRRPSLPLSYRISVTPWDMRNKRSTSLQDVHRIRVRLDSDVTSPPLAPNPLTRASRVFSVPDSLDRIGASSPILSPDALTFAGSALSLDTSPLPDPTLQILPPNRTSSPIVAVAGGTFGSLSCLDCVTSPSAARQRAKSLTDQSSEPGYSIRKRPKSLPGIFREAKKELSPRPASAAMYLKSLSVPAAQCPIPHARLQPQISPQPKPRSRPTSQVSPQPVQRQLLPQASPQPLPRQPSPKHQAQTPAQTNPQPHPRPSPQSSPQHEITPKEQTSLQSSPTKVSKPPPAKSRARYLAGAVQIMPVNGEVLKLRHKSLSRSNEALFESDTNNTITTSMHSQENASTPIDTISRPVPKPRRQTREEELIEPVLPKRNSKVTFSDQPHILNATSPTDSDSSVGLTTSVIESTPKIDVEDLPPPRPRKDSGPPTFVPPPPPQEQEENTISILDS